MNFFQKIRKHESNICLVDENNKVFTYKKVFNIAEKNTRNLKERSLIFVLAENDVEFITNYIGFLAKNLVPMLINPKIEIELLRNLIRNYLPSYIFLPISKKISIEDYQEFKYLKKYKILKIKKKTNYLINKNLALLLSTSGSTGSKKFVRISHENINDNTKNIVKYLKIKKNQRTITTMPPHYTYGLSIINTHLYAGASIFVTNMSVVEKKFWKKFKEQKINSFGGVPYFYEIIKKINFDKMQFPNLKYFTQAGGSLNIDLTKYYMNYAEKNNIDFVIMYGQVEATSRMTYLPYKILKRKIGSIGKPIPGGKIYLQNEKKSNDKKGEIIYKGKNVSLGYSTNYRDLEKGDENKGILNTGDLAKKDEDGYFFITGRKSRNVKLYGHRVNLDEIEKILQNKGYKCLCLGQDNKVTIFSEKETNINEIINYLSKIMKIHYNCFNFKFIKKFPMSSSNKISYKELEKLI